MICPEFPPVNTTGNYRSGSLARHLYSEGFTPIIFTVTEDSGEKTFGKKVDKALMDDFPEPIKIYRFPVRPISTFFSKGIGNAVRIWWNTTDRIDKRWYGTAVKMQLDKVIRKERPDIIYFSLPPFSFARLAIKLAIRYRTPLIVDMRDAWSLWCTNPFSTRLHYLKVKYLERRLFSIAAKIITVTPELADDFRKQHPSIPSDKFEVIYNGYDPTNDNLEEITGTEDPNEYHIGYVGSFYYNPDSENLQYIPWCKRSLHKKFYYWPRKEQWIYRSPYFFLQALREYYVRYPEGRRIVFHHVGLAPDWFLKMIESFQLESHVVLHGFQSKKRTLAIQHTWDAILATSEKIVEGKHFCLPSKSFDGIASGKQIFAFITDGTQRDFYHDIEQAIIVNPDEYRENAKFLNEIVNKKVNFVAINSILNDSYYRKNQLEKIYLLLYSVLNEKN